MEDYTEGSSNISFPRQMLSFKAKGTAWKKQHLLWARNKAFLNYSLVRKSVVHKKINYDLVDGKLHMSDLQLIINPNNIIAGYIPDNLQHYPIINSKLNVLRGEEISRPFEYKVVVTNPTAISEIEENKKNALFQDITNLIKEEGLPDDEFQQKLDKLNYYYTYEWQDLREIRANCLLNHYSKELQIPKILNDGFLDAMTCAEEIYQCDIIGGEPSLIRLNPMKVRVFKSGYSNRIEDADVVLIEDYWNPGRVIDTFYDVLTKDDVKYIETLPDNIGQASTDAMDNIDERFGFVNKDMIGDEVTSQDGFFFSGDGLISGGYANTLMPYDIAGNVRVIRMYWKSKRKIFKVKSYDQQTGEEQFDFYPETYVPDTANGEEATAMWINEAWEGTLIGDKVFVNMRPRLIQYNRLSNPSRCHFGIIGNIYNVNEGRPFSLVDMMKPYSYMYDAVHDRLNKAIADNWGKIVLMDFSKIPEGWDIDKWMYFARVNHIAAIDSFKEGVKGVATGKLAGALNNNTQGVIDAETGNYIQQQINLLEYIKQEMGDIAGISRQREGQISNRETVGGVERATLQSSHITEWLFYQHASVKKRVLECFLETAKIALKGHSKKFEYILPDTSLKIMDIDGDEFAECDYGLAVDDSEGTQKLQQQLDTLAQAALQNQLLDFSTIMKIYSSCSLAEKQRMIEKNEQDIKQQKQQEQQQALQSQQQIAQQQLQQKQLEMDQRDSENIRDNQTKVIVAQIQASASPAGESDDGVNPTQKADELREKIREFDSKMSFEEKKLTVEMEKARLDHEIKKRQVAKSAQKKQ